MNFYFLKDDAPAPSPSDQQLSAGRLEYTEFEALQKLGIIEPQLDYYQDFRWSFQEIIRKWEKIHEIGLNRIEVNRFKNILNQAIKNEYGLLAHSD